MVNHINRALQPLNVKTAILGGGLTGVTLARLLAAEGQSVVVLEKEDQIGGLCRSVTAEGFTFDRGGSHIIFSRDQQVLGLMHEVLGQNRSVRHRSTKIFYKGRYLKYPFENGLADLPEEDLYHCISEFIRTLIASEKGEIPPPVTFKDWILATFGQGIADCYMIPYNEKIWKYPADQMSCHWVEGRIPRPPVEDIIRSAIGIETEGYTHQAVFSYPTCGGIEALVTAMAEPIRDCIRTSYTVRSIRRDENGWEISDGEQIIRADRLVSTIPLQVLLPCLAAVPPAVQQACNQLQYNSVCCVNIGVKGEVPDYSWAYIPDPAVGRFNRISFPSNYSSEVAPPGCSSVLAEITYRDGDEVACMSDQQVIEHVVKSLDAIGVISADQVIFTSVEREQYAYVIFDLEYTAHITTVKEFCSRAGIELVGRFAEFEYLNMDGCIRHALDLLEKSP